MYKIKSLLILLLLVFSFQLFAQKIKATHRQTGEVKCFKLKKIRNATLINGVFLAGKPTLRNQRLWFDTISVTLDSISAFETKRLPFGKVVSTPFKLLGIASSGLGLLMIGADLSDDSLEDGLAVLLVGTSLVGLGAGSYWFSEKIEPSKKRTINVLSAKEWEFQLE